MAKEKLSNAKVSTITRGHSVVTKFRCDFHHDLESCIWTNRGLRRSAEIERGGEIDRRQRIPTKRGQANPEISLQEGRISWQDKRVRLLPPFLG